MLEVTEGLKVCGFIDVSGSITPIYQAVEFVGEGNTDIAEKGDYIYEDPFDGVIHYVDYDTSIEALEVVDISNAESILNETFKGYIGLIYLGTQFVALKENNKADIIDLLQGNIVVESDLDVSTDMICEPDM